MPAGIYCITNLINGKKYIGQSIDIKNRWANERSLHAINPHLKGAFKKYGLENFRFEIIEDIDPSMENFKQYMDGRERHFIDYYDTRNKFIGYNKSFGGCSNAGFKHTEEWKRKASERHKGNKHNVGRKMSEAHKARLREVNTGRKMPASFSEQLSKRMKGKKLSPEQIKKMSEAKKGQLHTEETKAKMRASQAIAKLTAKYTQEAATLAKMKPVRCIETGMEFDSCKSVAIFLGKDFKKGPVIGANCNGKSSIAFGFHWEWIKK